MESYVASDQEIQALFTQYQNYLVDNPSPYVRYFFKTPTATITIYNSKKVVIQHKNSGKPVVSKPLAFVEHIGSDESGTGDFFGGITVCCCGVKAEDLTLLKELKVADSKKISDERIKVIAPILMSNLNYALLEIDNEKYNEVYRKYQNMNIIKALLHNQVFINLSKKMELPKLKVIDDFCGEHNYYQYLKNVKTVVSDLVFETKAESKYLAVACASIIARYALLRQFELLEQMYQIPFPKNANFISDEAGKLFLEKYGMESLHKVAKMNFSNVKKITDKAL